MQTLSSSRSSKPTTAFSGTQRPIYILIKCALCLPHLKERAQTDHATQHDFNFRNKAALLTEIQRQTKKGGGLSVRALKESWKEAPQAIEELEQEGEVLVTRTQKDGQLRMVFWNEIKPEDEAGGVAVDKGALSPLSLFCWLH